MNKYNVGDVVKLRDDLELRTYDGDFYCNYIMTTFKGQKATIASVSKTKPYYTIEEDYRAHYWTDEMIEGLWEECNTKNVAQVIFETMNNNDNFPKQPLKLIDVLNMIAKGELKEGTKVKYKNIEWEYKTFGKEGEKDLVDKANFTLFEQFYMDALSEEVELIEPSCEGKTLEPSKIEELDEKEFAECDNQGKCYRLFYKLNEVIDIVNTKLTNK